MNRYYDYEDSMRIKVYDDGKLIGTVEIDFDDYGNSYSVREEIRANYDYYEDRYFE